MSKKTICIYHANCQDGFASAWAVHRAFGSGHIDREEIEFFPGVYNKPPPDVTGARVIMVDFSYKRPVLEEMAAKAQSILILDHHKTAAEDLAGFEDAPAPEDARRFGWLPDSGVYATFDMNRSGAGITWDHFHGPESRPMLINHIEDRDLWRFKLAGTREIVAAVFSYPYDFEAYDFLMHEVDALDLISDGEAIERKHHKDIRELVEVCQRRLKIGGVIVPAASLPYTLTSDAGHLMAQGEPFAACYWDTPTARVFSLRSTDEGMDVQAIAKQYGGGGHAKAAGFEVPLGEIGQFEV